MTARRMFPKGCRILLMEDERDAIRDLLARFIAAGNCNARGDMTGRGWMLADAMHALERMPIKTLAKLQVRP